MADRYLKRTYRILEATDSTEYNALNDSKKAQYAVIISAGIVDFCEGSAVKTALWAMFGEGTTTRTNLEALEKPPPIEE